MKNRKNTIPNPEEPVELHALKTLAHARYALHEAPFRGYEPYAQLADDAIVHRFIKEHERVVPPGLDGASSKDSHTRYIDIIGFPQTNEMNLSVSEVRIVNPSKSELTTITYMQGRKADQPIIRMASLSQDTFQEVTDPAERLDVLRNAEALLGSVSDEVFNMPPPELLANSRISMPRRGLPDVGVHYIDKPLD